MVEDFKDVEIFEGKNLSELFKEIYTNSQDKKAQIKELISSLSPLIQGIGDATLLVPLIKDYLDISVKNDEQLIKLAQIVQRLSNDKKQASDVGDIWSSFASALEDDKNNGTAIAEIAQEQSQIVAS